MGDTKGWSRFPTEMYGMRTSDHDRPQAGRKEYKRIEEKGLKRSETLMVDIGTRDTVFCLIIRDTISLLPGREPGAKRPEGGADDMNKYELAVVVSAKIEDDERAQVIEKVKELVTRFGGNVTDVDEWGKRRFAYEIQKMKEAYYYFIHFESDAESSRRNRTENSHHGQRTQIFMRKTGCISRREV